MNNNLNNNNKSNCFRLGETELISSNPEQLILTKVFTHAI